MSSSSSSTHTKQPSRAVDATSWEHSDEGRQDTSVTHQPNELLYDQMVALLHCEASYVVPVIPCTAISSSNTSPSTILPLDEWRRKICTWSFRVIDHFRLDRQVVSIGMNILDRFLILYDGTETSTTSANPIKQGCHCPACKRSVDSQTYQLAAMTCMYLAIKVHDEADPEELFEDDAESLDGPPHSRPVRRHRRSHSDTLARSKFQLQTFADLSRGMFTIEDICRMEQVVLQTVQWKVSATPTPMTFCNYLLTTILIPMYQCHQDSHQHSYDTFSYQTNGYSCQSSDLVLHVVRELARYLTELAVSSLSSFGAHNRTTTRPSHVAVAAIQVAMDLLTPQALPHTVRRTFVQRVMGLLSTTCGPQDDPSCHMQLEHCILELSQLLRRALWPEMLLEDGYAKTHKTGDMDSDACHPIVMARDCGILDLEQIYRTRMGHSPSTSHQRAQAVVKTASFAAVSDHSDDPTPGTPPRQMVLGGGTPSSSSSPTGVADRPR